MDKKLVYVVVGLIVAGAVGGIAVALPDLNGVSHSTTTVRLPTGCVRPADGFLIIASLQGFNDSIDHGVPTNDWPVMSARVGQNVTIVVCNADPTEAHGFQIDHYYDRQLVSVAPGQVLRVTFIASQSGTFRVYCQIPCSVHWAMQNGELTVS